MKRWFALAAVALAVMALPAAAAGITGQYVECRTCDVYTGPCFANAEMTVGKNAVLGWKADADLLTATGFRQVGSRRDLAGIERCSGGRRLELG